jgi:predicted CoA-binding protein
MVEQMPPPLFYDDDDIYKILRSTNTIALVGASPKWVRPSNFVMKYMQGKGFRVIPVNPGFAGKKILGETVYATLEDIPYKFDMIDIFRSSVAAAGIVDEALDLGPDSDIKTIWMQLTVRNDIAAQKAVAEGVRVVMDRCPKIEYGRLFGELGWSGVNSGIITSKRRRLS